MRILLVNNRFPPYITGGYEHSAALAAEGLSARGHEVRVLTGLYGVGSPRSDGHVRRCLSTTVESPLPHRLAWLEWRDAHALAHDLREFQPDVVSAWNLNGLFPSVLRTIVGSPIPAVFHLHDLYFDHLAAWAREWCAFWKRPAGATLRTLPKRALATLLPLGGVGTGWPETAASVPLRYAVFCSESIRRRSEEAGVRPDDWRVVFSGVDTRVFHPGAAVVAHEGLRLLFVGRLHPLKGAHLAVEAVARLVAMGLEAVTLTMLGAVPPDRAYYESLLRRAEEPSLRGRIVFRTLETNSYMPHLYRSHDVLVFPTNALEGMPRAPMEAMACGLVVVGTTAGGGAELLVDGVNALVVPQNDPVALAARLSELLKNRDRLLAIGAAARRHIEQHHDVELTLDAIESYYVEVVEKAQREPGRTRRRPPASSEVRRSG